MVNKFENWIMELLIIFVTVVFGVGFHCLHPLLGAIVFFLGGMIFKSATDLYNEG